MLHKYQEYKMTKEAPSPLPKPTPQEQIMFYPDWVREKMHPQKETQRGKKCTEFGHFPPISLLPL